MQSQILKCLDPVEVHMHAVYEVVFAAEVRGVGCRSRIRIKLNHNVSGTEIGTCEIGMDNPICRAVINNVTGHHAVYFIVEDVSEGWGAELLKDRQLFEIESFVFAK